MVLIHQGIEIEIQKDFVYVCRQRGVYADPGIFLSRQDISILECEEIAWTEWQISWFIHKLLALSPLGELDILKPEVIPRA